MFTRFFFILFFIFLIQSCSNTVSSIPSYKSFNNTLKKTLKFKKADLVLIYDLSKLDNTECIFSKKFRLSMSDRFYAKNYLEQLKKNYNSELFFFQESKLKVEKIITLVTRLQNKYNLLTKNDYQDIKKILNCDLQRVNPFFQLAKLDLLTSNLPIMLPLCNSYISSNYGIRKYPAKRNKMHCGIDLVSKYQSPIYASGNGKVSFVGYQKGYGITVEINHGNNIKSKYSHLKKTLVKKGQKILRTDIIGLQGKSGNARGTHLHFEIHIAGNHINPYDFIGHSYECLKNKVKK